MDKGTLEQIKEEDENPDKMDRKVVHEMKSELQK